MRVVALLMSLAVGVVVAPLAADAQQPGKVYRIGYLGLVSPSDPNGLARTKPFRQGLRDLGYVEGNNIVIEYRWAEGKYERLPVLAAELVRLKVDVIITAGTGVLAAKQATTTIPIVMAVGGDVVAMGLVASLARPGGNITGSTIFFPELSAKRLELLKEAVPGVGRVAVLVNPDNPALASALKVDGDCRQVIEAETSTDCGARTQRARRRLPDDGQEASRRARSSRGRCSR